MRATEILPEVSVIDAILLFRRLGVDVTGMAADALKAARLVVEDRQAETRGSDEAARNQLELFKPASASGEDADLHFV